MEEKKCFCCGEVKPFSDFYKHPKMADGHLGKCKECQKAAVNKVRSENIDRYRAFDRERANLPHRVKARDEYQKTESGKLAHSRANTKWMINHPNRKAANVILNNALKRGAIMSHPCFICGAKAHAHHPDYDRPLDVIWLCPRHHKEAHKLAERNDSETSDAESQRPGLKALARDGKMTIVKRSRSRFTTKQSKDR